MNFKIIYWFCDLRYQIEIILKIIVFQGIVKNYYVFDPLRFCELILKNRLEPQ